MFLNYYYWALDKNIRENRITFYKIIINDNNFYPELLRPIVIDKVHYSNF